MRALVALTLLLGCTDSLSGGALQPDIGGPIRLPGADGGRVPVDGAALPADDGDLPEPPDADARPDVDPDCVDEDEDQDGYGALGRCGPADCDDGNGAIHPGAFEACNDLDEDCDGITDEGLNFAVCGVGACRVMMPNCSMGRAQRCVPGEPAPEVCNEQDDDCDGVVDEDGAAATCGVGACQRRASCADGGQCTPGDPTPEVCNGVDDDCDGAVDNGFRAEVVQTTYSELSNRHPNCNSGPERIGPNCNAAMNRLCGGRGCATSGFGPVENSGDVSVVTCVRTAPTEQVPFATLASHHEVCDGNRERIGPNCNAAIHRYCASRGHVSGFGPIESGPDFVFVACVDGGATAVGTRYSVLTTHHPPCNGQGQRIGPDCNAAIHRFCRSQGFVSGFGPVENSGDDAAVICVAP